MTLKIALLLIPLFVTPQTAVKEVEMEITAYCSCERCCGTSSPGITASGHKLRQGDLLIAAPKTIKFGTKIFVPGYGLASVEDRGGAIKDNRLDVYFSTHKEALEWGRKILKVKVYSGN